MNVANFKDHQSYPKINGIVYPDGSLQLANVSVSWGCLAKFEIRLGEKTTLDELASTSSIAWADGAILTQTVSADGKLEVLGGEGDYGSDGFVALLDAMSQKLIWLAAFDCSNPFDSAKFEGDLICATTTLGNVWKFPIANPQKVSVD